MTHSNWENVSDSAGSDIFPGAVLVAAEKSSCVSGNLGTVGVRSIAGCPMQEHAPAPLLANDVERHRRKAK